MRKSRKTNTSCDSQANSICSRRDDRRAQLAHNFRLLLRAFSLENNSQLRGLKKLLSLSISPAFSSPFSPPFLSLHLSVVFLLTHSQTSTSFLTFPYVCVSNLMRNARKLRQQIFTVTFKPLKNLRKEKRCSKS